MQQEIKEEREGGGSLSSLPLEGRVYGEGLGSGYILQGKKKSKWDGRGLVPNNGSLAGKERPLT